MKTALPQMIHMAMVPGPFTMIEKINPEMSHITAKALKEAAKRPARSVAKEAV
jgi:hypothetical protein